MSKDIFNFKTHRRSINGVTMMNHDARLRLNLDFEMYVFVDAIHKLSSKMEKYTYDDLYRYTGIEETRLKELLPISVQQGLILKEKGLPPEASEKWTDAFKTDPNEFEKFWRKETLHGKELKWNGSKADAEQKYNNARKKYHPEFLYSRKIKYFEYMAVVSYDRQIMGASVFLNLKTERFNENWEEQTKMELERRKKINDVKIGSFPAVVEPLTAEQLKELFKDE